MQNLVNFIEETIEFIWRCNIDCEVGYFVDNMTFTLQRCASGCDLFEICERFFYVVAIWWCITSHLSSVK